MAKIGVLVGIKQMEIFLGALEKMLTPAIFLECRFYGEKETKTSNGGN